MVFDDMIADVLSNKKHNPVVRELFIRDRKLNISLGFITQSYFVLSKIDSVLCSVMKILNKQQLQQLTINSSPDIDLRFYKSFQKCTATPYSFLVNDITLPTDNPLCFSDNLLERIQEVVKIDEKIRDEKLEQVINRESAKLSINIIRQKKYYLQTKVE